MLCSAEFDIFTAYTEVSEIDKNALNKITYPRTCERCQRIYKNKFSYSTHKSSCGVSVQRNGKRINSCPEANCSFKHLHKHKIMEHIQIHHLINYEIPQAGEIDEDIHITIPQVTNHTNSVHQVYSEGSIDNTLDFEIKQESSESDEQIAEGLLSNIPPAGEIDENSHIMITQVTDPTNSGCQVLNEEIIITLDCGEIKQESSECDEQTSECLLSDVSSGKGKCTEDSSDELNEFSKSRDQLSTFSEYIALRIRKLNPRNQVLAQNFILNKLLDLELKEEKEIKSSVIHDMALI